MNISTKKNGAYLKRPSITDETAYFYMIDNFLKSRADRHFHTNEGICDEDVNIYIANLLADFSDAGYHEKTASVVIPYDLALNERVEKASGCREKYRIYRTNADFLLVSLGIFDNPKRSRPNSGVYMNLSKNSYTGRGKSYYRLAESYLGKASRGKTAMGEVLCKLSTRFEDYVKVLGYMRGEYLNFISRISSGELFHLERSVQAFDRESELRGLRDRFLDLYSEYMKNKTLSGRERLEKSAREIRLLDPSFNFRIR